MFSKDHQVWLYHHPFLFITLLIMDVLIVLAALVAVWRCLRKRNKNIDPDQFWAP